MPEALPPATTNPYGFQGFDDFLSDTSETHYICEGILAKGQPLLLAGPEKSLKTSILLDLAFSISTGTPFLGVFDCATPMRVGVMTGEADAAKLRRSLRCLLDRSPQHTPVALSVTQSLPVLSDAEHLQMLQQTIAEDQLDVLCIDPAYLCLGAASERTSNVAVMGKLLRGFDDVGRRTGCTLVLAHHANRKSEIGKPLDLRDVTGAGFAEWARQWILLNPITRFDPRNFHHRLWMVTGGSAGHAGRFAVDVREKDDGRKWAWVAEVHQEEAERSRYKTLRAEKASKGATELENNVLSLLQRSGNNGMTIRELKARFQSENLPNHTKINALLMQALAKKQLVKAGTAKRGNSASTSVWIAN